MLCVVCQVGYNGHLTSQEDKQMPQEEVRSWRPASCLHSEGALHTRPRAFLGPLPHVREEEPGVPAGGTGAVPALNPHQTGASCSSTWVKGPWPLPRWTQGTGCVLSCGTPAGLLSGLWPRAGRTRWAGEAMQRVFYPGDMCPNMHVTLLSRPHPGLRTAWDLGTLVPVCMENLPSDWLQSVGVSRLEARISRRGFACELYGSCPQF